MSGYFDVLRIPIVIGRNFEPPDAGRPVVILAAAGLAASYVPARRAARVDPVLALRHE